MEIIEACNQARLFLKEGWIASICDTDENVQFFMQWILIILSE